MKEDGLESTTDSENERSATTVQLDAPEVLRAALLVFIETTRHALDTLELFVNDPHLLQRTVATAADLLDQAGTFLAGVSGVER